MKKITLCLTLLLAAYIVPAEGQTANDTVALKEVVVEAARVVKRVDGETIFPSEAQKKNSFSGYSLLSKLPLQGIRVNEAARSVSAINPNEGVQIRVNGIVASGKDMLSLDATSVTQVEFIRNPGVRYGAGIAYVINIRTRRTDVGHTVGADATNTLTSAQGNNDVYASVNRGKSQLRVFYEQGYIDQKGSLTNETADYLLADGSTYRINRDMQSNRTRNFSNSVEMKYNLADTLGNVFQAALQTGLSNRPRTFSERLIKETDKTPYMAEANDKSRNVSPVLDLYLFRQLGKHQSLTANAVATYIHTLSNSSYDEGSPYAYQVNGKTYSLIGEAIYENRLRPFTLSAGMNINTKYMDNVYSGDASSANSIHSTGVYAFAQISGQLRNLGYMAGLGISNQRYRQGASRYDRLLWRPKAQAVYTLTRYMSVAYSIEMSQHISQIAMISDTRIRQNSMEWKVGNPNLKPSGRIEQNLSLNYNRPRLSSQIAVMYRINNDVNLGRYTRTDNNEFLYTQANQPHCNMLYAYTYNSVDLIPDHLQLMVSGSVARFWNKGDDYNHCYTSFGCNGSIIGYWGKWQLQLSADSGWRFMEAEMKGYNAGYVIASLGYRAGNCNITAYVQNPFQKNPLTNRSTTLNRLVNKRLEQHSTDMGNVVSLSVAWRLSSGRRYKDVEKRLNNKEKETGILK